MEFPTPEQVSQHYDEADLSVEEISAACDIARPVIAETLGIWEERYDPIRAEIELSKAQWNAISAIIQSELEESGWEIERAGYGAKTKPLQITEDTFMATPDGDKKCVFLYLTPKKGRFARFWKFITS